MKRLIATGTALTMLALLSGSQSDAQTRAYSVSSRLALSANTLAQDLRTVPSDRASIDWASAQADARRQTAGSQNFTAALPVQGPVRPGNREAGLINETELPVLIPSAAALGIAEAQTFLFPRRDFYTLSASGDGVVVEVFGTRLIQIRDVDARSARRLRAGGTDGFRSETTETGREIHFNRYGAAYSVLVECDAPQTDTRCTDESYVRNIARTLIIAGGQPGEGD